MLQEENEKQMTYLDVLATDLNGIGYSDEFTVTNDLYYPFLPIAEYMLKSISFDPDKVASGLNLTSAGNTYFILV